jgi:hypothetical protein
MNPHTHMPRPRDVSPPVRAPPARRDLTQLSSRVTSVAMPGTRFDAASCGRGRPQMPGPATNVLARLPVFFGRGVARTRV